MVAIQIVLFLVSGTVSAEAPIDYLRDIRPLLANHCFPCHGPDRQQRQAGLRLDQGDSAREPADSGAIAVVPANPDASELMRRISSSDESEVMPPPDFEKRLTPMQRQLLHRWIEQGAPTDKHWSLVPPRRSRLPKVSQTAWPRNGVDYFVLAALEAQGLAPSPEADPFLLLRRLSFDLTGLPPEPDDVEQFVREIESSEKHLHEAIYLRWVDRYMASPAYGERMAVDWLDAARFADSNGYQVDRDREMYAWRDWVIAAFNRNQPFDQFTIEQLAGDLLPNPTLAQKIATGFHRNHMLNEEGGIIPAEFLAEYCFDRVETTATVWLGQTFNCCRCHDHKYDPFTQQDYYGMYAFFHNIAEKGIGDYGAHIRRNAPPILKLPAPELESQLTDLDNQIASQRTELEHVIAMLDERQPAWEDALRSQSTISGAAAAESNLPDAIKAIVATPVGDRTAEHQKALADYFRQQDDQYTKLQEQIDELEKERKRIELEIPTTWVMQELDEPRTTHVLMRGSYDQFGETVTAGVPAVLPPIDPDWPRTRLGLARWLVDPRNPLTARVIVNRYWQSLFGRGLVDTADDFGTQGGLPSHPELLDWLALDFRESGWNIKRMMRMLVTSATYRQSSRGTPDAYRDDPDNRWMARGPRFRLPAEMIRDQALAASRLLVPTIGGPSVRPYHPAGLYEQVVAGRGRNTYEVGKGSDLYRRSLYTYWKRSVPHPAMLAFDAPFRETCSVRRSRTNTPLQALNLMNDPTYVEAARLIGQRVLREASSEISDRVRHAYQLVLCRQPTADELQIVSATFERARDDFVRDDGGAQQLLSLGEAPINTSFPSAELAAMTTVATTLLNLDEAVTKP